MRFEYTNGCNEDFLFLCQALDDFLNGIAGGEENRTQYIALNIHNDIHDVIVVYDQDKAIGCASFKRYDDKCAEVKRVFICEEYRGKGLSRELMKQLENTARKKGFTYLILESGEPLVAAMSLYRSIGYTVIPNYDPYVDLPDSICMRKKLL